MSPLFLPRCPSSAIKFERIASWTFKQMSVRRAEPKVARNRTALCKNYIVCSINARRHSSYSQQHSGVTMIQSNEDRDSVSFFGRGGEWLKASDGKNQRLQLFRVHTAYLSHSGFRWDKLAAECQNPVWEKVTLFQHEWAASVYVCVCLYVTLSVLCATFVLAPQCDFFSFSFFDSNDVGPLANWQRVKGRMGTRVGNEAKGK